MSTIVHFTKHWDNDTKGYIEIDAPSIISALAIAESTLREEALEDNPEVTYNEARTFLQKAFTLTKAEFGAGSNWTGVPKAAF